MSLNTDKSISRNQSPQTEDTFTASSLLAKWEESAVLSQLYTMQILTPRKVYDLAVPSLLRHSFTSSAHFPSHDTLGWPIVRSPTSVSDSLPLLLLSLTVEGSTPALYRWTGFNRQLLVD